MAASQRMHALWARQLIAACGGLDEAAGACRLNKSRLSQCQDPDCSNAFLPADAIADLEAYCGKPIYSQRLTELRPSTFDAQALLDEVMDAGEAASALLKEAREAVKDGHLSPRERDTLRTRLLALQDEARQVGVALNRGEGGEGEP